MKLFEYMASGKAIIASAVGQITDVIQDGVNGVLVPPGDVLAMATAMDTLIHNTDLRCRLGNQARADAVRDHSWEQYVTRLDRVFRAIIGGEPIDHQ
jgi:glycosyltransferase involved in cell wall biosynthesis